MLILGIDTSGKAALVSLVRDGQVLVDYTLNNERTHSEKLLLMIDNAFKISRTSIEDVDGFALVSGPGSFTGLRIGAATIKGLCGGKDKKIYLTTSLEALAESVRVYDSFPICAMIDAGREEVYTAIYHKGECLLKETAMNVKELSLYIKENYEKVIFTGDGVIKYKEIISEICENAEFAESEFLIGRGYAIVKAALKHPPVSEDEVTPLYLKVSQAERLRK